MNRINSLYSNMNSPYLHLHTKNNRLYKGQNFGCILIDSNFLSFKKTCKPLTLKRYLHLLLEYSILHIALFFLYIFRNAQEYSILRIDQKLFKNE